MLSARLTDLHPALASSTVGSELRDMEIRRASFSSASPPVSSTLVPSITETEPKDPEKGRLPEEGSQEIEETAHDVVLESEYPRDGGLAGWTLGLFQTYYEQHLLKAYAPSTISWIFTTQMFLMWTGGAFFGRVVDTYGTQVVAIPCTVGCTFSIFMLSFCTSYYQIFLCQGVGFGVSAGGLFSCATTSVGQWFEKRKALALGTVLAGSSLGGVLHSLYLIILIQDHGFATAVRWSSLVVGLTGILACVLMRPRLPKKKWAESTQWIDSCLFKQATFRVYCLGTFFVVWGLFAPWNYLPSMALSHGFSNNLAVYTIVVLNAASIFGRILPAWLADRFGRFNSVSLIAFTTALSLLAFWLPTEAAADSSHAQIFAFSAVYGFASGAFISVMMPCAADLGPVATLGQRFGTYQAVVGLASLTSLPIQGALIPLDRGGFTYLIVFSGVCVAVGTVFICAARMLRVGCALRG
ncbi:uncharacterized protein L3040_007845 [Drepanopeziza brunnea f. sp. 'multigermtubi']|uniref:uncharacterized protein n=1 Tax=Drepanopeziza brunnea f. sp. 'multigermtubi' TaxID=698441 RepID=UPI002397BA8F|nr:hypothetical protein L3040_007845 [Drepanopeziza brunnea f. sp. 'multigermtubi']